MPYPRGGISGPGYQHLRSAWCAQDRKQAMVDRGFLAGKRIGITGTPALIKSNGEKIEGYRPYQDLIPQVLQ